MPHGRWRRSGGEVRGRAGDGYCRELRSNLDELVGTRRRLIWALVATLSLGVVLTLAGKQGMAIFFGWSASVGLGVVLAVTHTLVRRLARKIADECPDPGPT